MIERVNEFGQPIGPALPQWTSAAIPQRVTLAGSYCSLAPLERTHAADLFQAYTQANDDSIWTYLRHGPFKTLVEYETWVETAITNENAITYVVLDGETQHPLGTLALMRIDPDNGSIEVGNVTFSPAMQGSRISTEAQFLAMEYAFNTLGYRRYEWKCDSLNLPSRRAAQRLGFQYEGTFRNAMVYSGRSRDTAWYSITDLEWTLLQPVFQRWLQPENFCGDKQVYSLATIRELHQKLG